MLLPMLLLRRHWSPCYYRAHQTATIIKKWAPVDKTYIAIIWCLNGILQVFIQVGGVHDGEAEAVTCKDIINTIVILAS